MMLEFIRSEQSVHNMARILGAIAKAYVTPKSDCSHANFRWCEVNQHLETRNFSTECGQPVWVSYHPAHLHFHMHVKDEKDNKKMVLIKNNSFSFVKNKFVSLLGNIGLDTQKFESNLDFRFPELLDNNGKIFLPDKAYLHQFETVRNAANSHLQNFLNQNNLQSEIRVWEYNFDTGIYCKHPNGLEQYAGYAPADKEAYDKPYFYNGFYYNGKKVIPNNFKPIKNVIWETDNWGGAILPMDSFNSIDGFLAAAPSFLQETTNEFIHSKT